ncbi:hypothetical protein V1514DRAFT_321665 [Lipomyces japonicus]|uniref:uncharacterized protein n=1 Tax=Lipomyces japonicus TaxID=56871 RepID=UPI0034CEF724
MSSAEMAASNVFADWILNQATVSAAAMGVEVATSDFYDYGSDGDNNGNRDHRNGGDGPVGNDGQEDEYDDEYDDADYDGDYIEKSPNDNASSSEVKKPRGRPRLGLQHTQTDRRRAQIRAAQRTYRLKKDQKIIELSARVKQLETTVADLSSLHADAFENGIEAAVRHSDSVYLRALAATSAKAVQLANSGDDRLGEKWSRIDVFVDSLFRRSMAYGLQMLEQHRIDVIARIFPACTDQASLATALMGRIRHRGNLATAKWSGRIEPDGLFPGFMSAISVGVRVKEFERSMTSVVELDVLTCWLRARGCCMGNMPRFRTADVEAGLRLAVAVGRL